VNNKIIDMEAQPSKLLIFHYELVVLISSYFLLFSAKAQDELVVGLGHCEGTLA